MSKKILAVILSLTMVAGTLIGCGNSADDTQDAADAPAQEESAEAAGESEEGPGEAAALGDEEVTVTILCAYASEDPHGQYVYEYADKFMEQYPNITVEVTAISSNDIYTKLAAMATSPDDLPTLFFTSVDQAPSLFDIGLMEDLKGQLDDTTMNSFANGIVDACTLDGQLAFYPIDVQPLAVIYRKDKFDEAGLSVPKTWDDFLECAKTLTVDVDGDGQIDEWGFSMVGSNNSSGQSRFQSFLWSQNIKQVTNDNGEWVTDLDSDEFLKAFTFWTDMNNEYGVVPTGITEVDYATAANYFAMGQTNMILSGSNALGVAYANNPDLEGKLGSFPLPGDYPGTMLNAEGYALCKMAGDEEKAAAVEFLKFFSSNDPEYKFWQSSGKIPATVEGQKVEYISGDDYKGYLETIDAGCMDVFNFPGLSALKSALGDAYSAVFSGDKTNEQAQEDLVKDVNLLLEDYN